MATVWKINAEDEETTNVEIIQQKPRANETELHEDGTKKGKRIDLSGFSDSDSNLQYWNGSAWTDIAGTVTTALSTVLDPQGNAYYEATFSRDTNATAALTPGQTYELRWQFSTAAGRTLSVPESGTNFMEINANPS